MKRHGPPSLRAPAAPGWCTRVLLLLACWVSSASAFASVTLVNLAPGVYQTEHLLFVIDPSVPWSTPSAAYADIYTAQSGTFPKLQNYFDVLQEHFPAAYFSVCYIANTGAPNVPNYIDRTFKANGINEPGTAGATADFAHTDICRYNLPGGNILFPALAVYDHELGHAWGAQVFNHLSPPSLSNGHWLPTSTVECQLSAYQTDDGGVTFTLFHGNPSEGFRWHRVNSLRENDWEVFSEQELYLMGLRESWPAAYVLNQPVANPDGTVSFASVDTFDQASLLSEYGPRTPAYDTSTKRFKLGFVYVARDVAEITAVSSTLEQSVSSLVNDEALSPSTVRFQTPFLCNTRYRASADALLTDLDGNHTPSLDVATPYVVTQNGSASIPFNASDPDGAAPTVSLVPSTTLATVSGNQITFQNLPPGVTFFTLKAVDAGGKKVFAHVVVENQIPGAQASLVSDSHEATVTTGTAATFSISTTSSVALAYEWRRKAARTSTWETLNENALFSGTKTSTLTVLPTPAMDGDAFACCFSDAQGASMSAGSVLHVLETPPEISATPLDVSATSGSWITFSTQVSTSSTFGYDAFQWEAQPPQGAWGPLSDTGAFLGTTTRSLRVNASLALEGYTFRCVVSNTAGSSTTSVATLNVGTRPQLLDQPLPQVVNHGGTASFVIHATGTAPLAYQWFRYGVALSGANGATLTLLNVSQADAGAYTVTVTNSFGSAASNVGTLTISGAPTPTLTPSPTPSPSPSPSPTPTPSPSPTPAPTSTPTPTSLPTPTPSATPTPTRVPSTTPSPTPAAIAIPKILKQPLSLTKPDGSTLVLTVEATGGALRYQWYKDDIALPVETASSLSLVGIQSATTGDYTVTVSNSLGSCQSRFAHVETATPIQGEVVNLSVLGTSGHNGIPLTLGFVVEGGTRTLLLRAAGPALEPFNVPAFLTDPQLEVFSQGTLLSANDDWQAQPSADIVADAIALHTGWLFAPASKDAALFAPVGGAGSAVAFEPGSEGAALAEAYVLEGQGHLQNLSVLNHADGVSSVLTVGFVANGNVPLPLLVRGIGPSLAQFGVGSPMPNPKIELHRQVSGHDQLVAENDEWSDEPDAAEATKNWTGFALSEGSLDAALVVTLPPGAYTILLTPSDGQAGTALVELYLMQ